MRSRAPPRSVRRQLRDHFRPEFLNRVDEIIVFRPLDEAQLREIVGLLVKNVERRVEERASCLEVTDAALTLLAREGYDPVYGARPAAARHPAPPREPARAGASWPASSAPARQSGST